MERKIIGDSKITLPKLTNILHRDRLIKMLEQNRERKIILILGQAAQGKSILAASYSKECKIPSAWINLNSDESDPVNFFLLMIHSLRNFFEKNVFYDLLNYVSMDFGPRAEKPLFQRWINILVGGLSSPVQIVIDGLDRLSHEAASFHLLQVFLEEANSKIRFVLLSRKEPPFSIQGLKMIREAAVIDNKQLAFTFEETKSFFNKLHGIYLPLNDIKRIHRLTEGWAGGLLIFSEAVKRTPKEVREKFFSKESISEFKKEAFRYLGEEIFSSLDEDVRDFLIKSSIFEYIDPVFVKRFLKRDNAEAILKELSERNLFTQEIYDQNHGWLFRYHQVFKDFLQTRFDAQITGEKRRRYYSSAAYATEQVGEHEHALDYYLKAKHYEGASKVLELIGVGFLKQGRTGDLSKRLRLFPEEIIRNNPWLLFYLSMTRRFTGMRENTQSLFECNRIFEKKGDIRGQILSLAFLIEAFLFKGYFTVPIEDLVTRAERLLDRIPQASYEYESAILWFQVAHALTICCGNPRKGIWCCQKAHLIAAHCGDINLQVSAMSREVEAHAWLGEFESADKVISKVHKLIEDSPFSELQVYYKVAVGRLLVLRGEMQKAREEILRAQATVEKHGLLFWHLPTLAVDIPICIYQGDFERAEHAIDSLLYMASSLGNQVFEGIAIFFQSLICDREGDLKRAKELAGDSARMLSSEESLTLWQYYAAVILRSLILYRLGEKDDTENELQKTIDDLSNLGCYLLLVDAHLVMAICKREQGRKEETASHLKEGFRIAKEKKHFHTILLTREDLADVCLLALELEVAETFDYASYLFSTHLSDLADPRLKKLEVHSNAKVAQQIGRAHV